MALLALFVFASLTWFAWQSFVGFDLLGKLALSLVLDFEQLLSFFLQICMIFWQKTASFRFLVGLLTLLGFHKLLGLLGWLAKLARSLVLDFEQILSFFLQQDQPPQNLEVEHDFLKIILPMVILKFVVFLSMLFWKKSHVPTQNSEVEHDFLKIVLPMWILKFVWPVPNFTKVVTSRKLWRHKFKLNLLKYRFLTKTYPILSGFKETFWIIPPFLPPFLPRPVCEGSRSLLWRCS